MFVLRVDHMTLNRRGKAIKCSNPLQLSGMSRQIAAGEHLSGQTDLVAGLLLTGFDCMVTKKGIHSS